MTATVESAAESICELDIVGIIEVASESIGVADITASFVEGNFVVAESAGEAISQASLGSTADKIADVTGIAEALAVLAVIIRVAPRVKNSVSQGPAFDKRRVVSASDPDVSGPASDTITDIHPSDGIWGQQ